MVRTVIKQRRADRRNEGVVRRALALALTIASVSATACNDSYDIPIRHVNSEERLDAGELQQMAPERPQRPPDTFYFGFDLRGSPEEDAAQYLPFLNYLETATGYRFKLHFTPKNRGVADLLGRDRIQFAAMGAGSFISAESQFGVRCIARGVNRLGKAEYQAVLVVAPDSPIRRIQQIKGARFAFGARESTQGHLIPKIMLSQNGITISDLRAVDFTGSHQNCAEAVITGHYDVCGMQDELARRLAERHLVRIIHTSEYYPSSGIAANHRVPEEVIAKVQQALIAFEPTGKHRHGLHNWERTEMPLGFISANNDDYNALRAWSTKLGVFSEGASTSPAP